MQLRIDPNSLKWWIWVATLVVVAGAVVGWTAGYYLAISVSLVHALFFLEETKSVKDFDTQLRLAYFALTLFGLWPGVRLVVFVLLLAETLMITSYDRSFIARGLKRMPWNRSHAA
jgi:hypothetical protein